MQSDDIAGTSKGAPAREEKPTAIKPTPTTADMGGRSKRRRQPLKPKPNLVKRRSTKPSAELPAEEKETARTANIEAKSDHQKPEDDNDVNYMSEGGEGHFVSGDSNKFAVLSSREPSSDDDEEEEQTLQTKINEFERKMDALRQEVAPLLERMKAKQDARRPTKSKSSQIKKPLKQPKQRNNNNNSSFYISKRKSLNPSDNNNSSNNNNCLHKLHTNNNSCPHSNNKNSYSSNNNSQNSKVHSNNNNKQHR
ncbi:probable basic-leucine zipper transcription factor E [Episyrphus balteatus]|uniref:probable basic-leucine zipper transcription factor E n=1 Tax=Episyrphus balteatus TaxID=286459 RepID=UPI002486C6B0|nr:probable basic-leucine zipper transcription factor E [Episyrphus balteatus]